MSGEKKKKMNSNAVNGRTIIASSSTWLRMVDILRLAIHNSKPLKSKALKIVAAALVVGVSMVYSGALWVGSRQGVRTVNKKREKSLADARRRSIRRYTLQFLHFPPNLDAWPPHQ